MPVDVTGVQKQTFPTARSKNRTGRMIFGRCCINSGTQSCCFKSKISSVWIILWYHFIPDMIISFGSLFYYPLLLSVFCCSDIGAYYWSSKLSSLIASYSGLWCLVSLPPLSRQLYHLWVCAVPVTPVPSLWRTITLACLVSMSGLSVGRLVY